MGTKKLPPDKNSVNSENLKISYARHCLSLGLFIISETILGKIEHLEGVKVGGQITYSMI